jgi:carbon monoxide dehydrogenase subunit G
MANMQFEGEETFAAPRERVYALLVDLDALPESIPDLTSSKKVDEWTLEAVVRPGFSFLRGTMKLRFTLDELKPTTDAVLKIDASGIGVSMKVTSRMHLSDAVGPDGGAATKLVWKAEVSDLKGLVATVSPGLVRAAADQVVRHGWAQLHEKLKPI